MSDSDDQRLPQEGGYSLEGLDPAEPLLAEWTQSDRNQSSTGSGFSSNRIGRTGTRGSSGNAPSVPPIAGPFATLRDMGASLGSFIGPGLAGFGGLGRKLAGLGSAGGDDGDDDDEDGPENESGKNQYTGGERSGISIENPDRALRRGSRDSLRKAAETGQTPASGEVESSYIPDPNRPQDNLNDDQEVAIRHITFWRDGFSFGDGPLMRYDEPANSQMLDKINAGNVPPEILNVRVGQLVELRVTNRLGENYVSPPKGPVGVIEGHDHRPGAAVPEVTSSSTTSSSFSCTPDICNLL